MAAVVVERTSIVDAPAEQVWRRVGDPVGINDELRPWFTMTVPRKARGVTLDSVPLGQTVGRTWVKLFGLLPVDYDDLTIVDREPGRSFREESTMLSARTWRHERMLTPVAAGRTEVHDRLTFEPRVPGRLSARVHAAIIRALFGHRHRRLARHFAR